MIRYFGQEPVFFGWERYAGGKIFSWSWFHQIDPPYRWGRGIRVRVGSRALHVGFVMKRKTPIVRDTDTTVEEISKWLYE